MRKLASIIDSGVIRPVVDRVFPAELTKEAAEYIDHGRAKGKVVVKVRGDFLRSGRPSPSSMSYFGDE